MAAQELMRKRKQQRPPREVAVLTRTKVRVVSHHNADIHCSLPGRRKYTRRSSFPCSREDDGSRGSIKDLRARRVFSDPMVAGEIGFGVNGEDGGSKEGFVGEEEGVMCPRRGDENIVLLENVDDSKEEGLIGETPNSSALTAGEEIEMESSLHLRVKGSGCVGFDELKLEGNQECENGREENIQTTPPAAGDAFLEKRGYEKEEIDGVEPKEDTVAFPMPECDPSRKGCRKDCGSPLSRAGWNDPGSTRKMVLKPCSRLKVYKSPNSFSYRRLLPFLMDLEKERSRVVQTIITPKEIPQQQLPVSAASHNLRNKDHYDAMEVGILGSVSHVTCSDARKEGESVSDHNVDSTLQHHVTRAPADSSYDDNQSNLVSSDSQLGSFMLNGVSAGSALRNEHISLDKPGNLDSGLDKVSTDAGLDQTKPRSSPDFVLAPSPVESTVNRLHCFGDKSSKEGLELLKTQNLVREDQSPANAGVVAPSEQLELVSGKRILKRNPRGCRGLCNCLDCSAFRLHAERAFEFSRNQLQAAEEVVLYLMKELSELRNILEKSVGNANSDTIVSSDQVNEACMKASEAEVVARDRLSQMNEDLHVHCRTKALQRPRVNFASK